MKVKKTKNIRKTCDYCGKETYKEYGRLKNNMGGNKGINIYCSKECMHKYWREFGHPNEGKKHSERYKKDMAEERKGENAPNWRGGKSFEPYSSEFNKDLKKKVRKRDNYTCQLCGKEQENTEKKLCVHHINYNKKNNSLNNLITLCNSCHSYTNKCRSFWERKLKKIVSGIVFNKDKIFEEYKQLR